MNEVTPAQLTWTEDDLGNLVPVSEIFGDVYYSLADGLAESRYVFIDQNKLPERFLALFENAYGQSKTAHDTQNHHFRNCDSNCDNNCDYPSDGLNNFTIAELGFGTGLNVLVTWQLWRSIKSHVCSTTALNNNPHNPLSNPPRLHLISTEKHPLSHTDLTRSLASWQHKDPSLSPLIEQLLALYPTLISGCHRLHLDCDVTLDLWLGDAAQSLQKLAGPNSTTSLLTNQTQTQSHQATSAFKSMPASVDAWYLDGFAPSCNESLWADQIFEQVARLSKPGTTAATFSSAGVVKRGLKAAGFSIKKTKGFGRKREMLTAIKNQDVTTSSIGSVSSDKARHDAHADKLQADKQRIKVESIDNLQANQQVNLHAYQQINQQVNQQVNLQANQKVHDQPKDIQPKISNYTRQVHRPVHLHRQVHRHVAVIGCGISGLMSAWALAQRGIQVTIIDKQAPLAGASGNPRALLTPKMTPIGHVAEHLHSISYLYSQRFYRQLDHQLDRQLNRQLDRQRRTQTDEEPVFSPVFEPSGTLDLLLKANVDVEQIAQYPDQMATTLSPTDAKALSGLTQQDLQQNLYLPQAGLVNPKALSDIVLAHPNISFKQGNIERIEVSNNEAQPTNKRTDKDNDETKEMEIKAKEIEIGTERGKTEREKDIDNISRTNKASHQSVTLQVANQDGILADAVIIAAAFDSKHLDSRLFECRKIRGQLSWFEPTADQLAALAKLPLKYGGYCAAFTPRHHDEQLNPVTPNTPTFLLGASFVRNDISTDIRDSEHAVNRDKLISAIPELASVLNNTTENQSFASWHARVGIRAQTPDYHPLVGQVDDAGLIWTMSGMGSKGYAFAPLCAQVLADCMTGQFTPLPSALLDRLSPHRKSLQKPLS